MARKRMSMNQDSIEQLFTSMNELSNDLESGKTELSTSCQIFNTTGLFLNGIKKISDQFSKLSTIALEIGRTARQKSESMFDKEMMLYHLAEDIEIPKDLSLVDTIESSSYQTVSLKKEDGKKVDSSASFGVADVDDARVNKVNLSNIDNGISDNSGVVDIKEPNGKKGILESINDSRGANKVSFDENEFDVNKIKFDRLDSSSSSVVDVEDSNGKKVVLESINDSNGTNRVSFDQNEFNAKKVKLNDFGYSIDNSMNEIKLNDLGEEEDSFFDDFYE